MKIIRTASFKKDYKQLPRHVQIGFEKKIRLFIENFHHPSLRVKNCKVMKIDGRQV